MDQFVGTLLKSKAKIEGKESVKPTVINNMLIRDYIIGYNKDNRIFDEDDIPLWDLEHLSLSYSNIIEIDNLGGM